MQTIKRFHPSCGSRSDLITDSPMRPVATCRLGDHDVASCLGLMPWPHAVGLCLGIMPWPRAFSQLVVISSRTVMI